jgi:GH35 family endo-1,4-beta-xylanase
MSLPLAAGACPRTHALRRFLAVERLEDRTTPAAGVGLQAQYYDNADFTALRLTRTDPTVNFDWGGGSPAAGVAADTFSVRWSGQVEAKFTEATTFTVTGDDGYRLWVNGQLLVNRWVDQAATATGGTLALVAGRRYDVVLEFYENGGNASARLEWQSASQPRQVIPAGQLFPAERGSITREVWSGIGGTSVSNLTGNVNFPNNPSTAGTRTSFEAPTNAADNYGQRMRGLLHAPTTGLYTFYVAGDDNCQLWLSNSADPAGKQQIASVPGWTSSRQWTKFPQQRSAAVFLAAGKAYFSEALQKEGGGGDNLAVGWVRPGTTAVSVIGGEFLSPVRPTVSLFAESPTTAEGASAARFSVVRTGPTTNPLTVRYTTRGTAVSGTDYAALPGTVTIPAGQRSVALTVSPLADSATEGTEQAVIELQAGGGYEVGRISERTAAASIQDDVAAPAGGTSLWAGTALANFAAFGGTFTALTDPVRGPAIQAVVSTAPDQPYFAQLNQAISAAVRKGDVLFVEFWARSTAGTGDLTAVFERNSDPYNKSLNRSLQVGTEWAKVQLPFVSDGDYAAGQASFGFHIGQKAQTLQFAGMKVLNYGPPSDLAPGGAIGLNSIGGSYGAISTVGVLGQPFAQAYRLATTTVPPDAWRLQGIAGSRAGVLAGDTLRVEFYARAETGAAPRIDFLMQRTDTYNLIPGGGTVIPTAAWTKYTFDVPLTEAFGAGGLQVVWNVGFGIQAVQVGGFTWTNLARATDIGQLPERFPATSYGGREGTAGWRADADARIGQTRAADLTVNVRDAAGNPIDGAVVSVRQTKHAFKFGSAVNGYDNLLSSGGQNADAAQYQALVKRLFTAAVLENNLKWPGFEADRQLGIDSAAWVQAAGLYQRGHNIIWPNRTPSFYMPEAVWQQYDSVLATQGQAAANSYLRTTIDARIRDAVQTFAGTIGEWDVVNEPFANNDVMRILDGSDGGPRADSVLLDWFRLVRQSNPTVKRVLNDYDIFANNGNNDAHQANFDAWLGHLTAQNLIEVIGEQSHYNEGNLTDITTLATLITDYNTRFNRPIAVTEFDVNTKDEQLQADYLRDYYTMAFSQGGIDQLLMWGFWEGSHWLPDAALYRDDFSIKPNGQVYEDMVFGDWWTDVTGTSRGGAFGTRAFQGEYEITVTVNGQTRVVTATVGPNGATVTVTV